MDISKLTIFIVLFVFSSHTATPVTCQPVKMESVLDEMEEEQPDQEHSPSGFITNKVSFEEHTKDFILRAQARRVERQTKTKEQPMQQQRGKNSAISSSDHLLQSSDSFIASYFSLHPPQEAFSRFKRFTLNGTVDPSRTNQLLLLLRQEQQQQQQQHKQQQQQSPLLSSSHNEITAATSILSNRRRKDTTQQSDSPEQQQQQQGDDFFPSSTKNPLSVLSRNWRRQQRHFFSK